MFSVDLAVKCVYNKFLVEGVRSSLYPKMHVDKT